MDMESPNVIRKKNIRRNLYKSVKRIMDIFVSSIALIFLSPVFLFVLIIDSFSKSNHGPVLYKQMRMGHNGKKFGMFKFRSMVVNAEKILYADQVLYQKYLANNYKLEPKDDPRITAFGRFLRKTSIDEIPQFINILLGDMSLVGPRPVIEAELVEYDDELKLLSVKPGAMGLWQASGRSKIGYPERAKIEMAYVDSACLFLDLKVILGNLKIILRGKGAY